MEQLTYNYLDKLLREHALQLEMSKVSPRWHITGKGKYGHGLIFGYVEYLNSNLAAKNAHLYPGKKYQLLASLMTILGVPFDSKEPGCY